MSIYRECFNQISTYHSDYYYSNAHRRLILNLPFSLTKMIASQKKIIHF